MEYTEALSYIHSVNNAFCKPGLERIGTLCERLGHPEKNLRFIHVAGTNGKGSFCSMLASILKDAGYRVGLYTSPHLIRFNERMQINGNCIEDDLLAEITNRVKPIADSMLDKPTEFELVTAISFVYFQRMNCDLVVLETGLGGRLDATNIIESPLVSVITGIDLDHTAILGDTYEKIAYEKAGIIKQFCPVVIGACNKNAKEVILQRAVECRSPIAMVDISSIRDMKYSLHGTTFSYGNYEKISLSLAGIYQPRNCATVIECIKMLRNIGYHISDEAVYSGFASTKWPGRFEVLSQSPMVIYDGGHNPQGVSAFVESLEKILPNTKVALVCGLLQDKDYNHMISAYTSVADAVFTLTVDSPRALPANELAKLLSEKGIFASPFENAEEAVRVAFSYAKKHSLPVVINGSLYMYSQIIDVVKSLIG